MTTPAAAAAALSCAVAAHAGTTTSVSVTVENLLPAGGTALTPTFLGLHDGSFDLFNPGEAVSPGLEEVAELGSTATLTSEFDAATSGGGLSQTAMGGPITGGMQRTASFDTDPTVNRFLNFASMVVPTNDLFIGNPEALEVFAPDGSFNGPITLTIVGGMVWDAGTELNDADAGAAFLEGIDATDGVEEGGVATLFFDDATAEKYLATLVGRTTAPGFEIESTFGQATPIARLTIVPTPGAAAALGLAGVAFASRRRR
jgi:hypothetical protein